jgi:glucose-6-phosphate-specific signal transduction histidine kinase
LTAWLLPVLGFELTTLLLGLSFLAAGSVAAWSAPRNSRLTTLFAIAVIISMFWSYRRGYDCALLVIPMVLLFEVAARQGSAASWILAFAFGVSLWLPVRNEQWSWTSVQIAHLAVWVTAAVTLYVSHSPEEFCTSEYSAERMRMEALA